MGPTTTDATLSALTVNDGTRDRTIDLTTTPYALNVGSAVETVTLTATPTTTIASVSAVTLGGIAIADTDFTDGITVPSLVEGDNVIVVTVTAQDGNTTQTYMVTVTRPPTGTCVTPHLGGRDEVWNAVLTVGGINAGTSNERFGYQKLGVVTDIGELSDESFQLGNQTVAVTEIVEFLEGIRFSFDKDVSLLPSFESLQLHFCDSALNFSDGTILISSKGIGWQSGNYDWSSTSTMVVALSLPSNSPATGHPSIEGEPKLRSTLTAGRGTIDDANGLDDADYSYQWIRIDGTNELEISDAVNATYTTTSDDVGKSLKVVATFTDDHGYPETLSSNPFGPVTARSCSAPSLGRRIEVWSAVLTVEALFAGSVEFGSGYIDTTNLTGGELSDDSFQLDSQTITVDELREAQRQIWMGFDVSPSSLPSFTSLRLHFCDSALDFSDGAIVDPQKKVSWIDPDYDWSSTSTMVVALSAPRPPNNPATGTPTITGRPKVGETLTASTADISDDDGKPSAFEYQWVRVNGSNRTNVGADQRTYTVTDDDAGSQIQVEVTFTDEAGYEEGPLRSARTDVVTTVTAPPAPGKPRVYPSPQQSGSTTELEVQWREPHHWATDPPDVDSYDVRYRVVGAQTWTSGPQALTVTRAALTGLVAGTLYEAQVRATNADGNSVWSQSGRGRTRTAGQDHEGDVRLMDGRAADEGRLEILHNGVWGSVCSDRFDRRGNRAPGIACRMLGYAGGEYASGYGRDIETSRQNPIWLDDVRCEPGSTHWTGSPATRLDQCHHTGWGLNNCTHEEDAGVRCFGSSTAHAALTSEFQGVPETHDGTEFTFQVAFSEDVTANAEDLRDHAFEVTGASITEVTAVDDRHDLWTVTVSPDSNQDVTVALEAERACDVAGAICTQDGGRLSETVSVEITALQGPLTAQFEDLPADHDGATAFTFRLSLSDDIANTDADVRDSAFEVTGGSVTDVGRVDGRGDLWEITVTPDGTGNVGIVLLADRACGTAGALCTADGRALTTALLVTVPAQPQQAGALTAKFADMPAEHGGAAQSSLSGRATVTSPEFTFTVRFSESFPISYRTMRDSVFTVTNGRVTRARRLDNPHHENQGLQPNREWEITVAPDTGAGDVTVTLPETTDCAATGAVCTEDGTMLSGAVSVAVPHTYVDSTINAGPAPLTAQFANVPAEHDGENEFAVELRFSEPPAGPGWYGARNIAVKNAIGITGGTVVSAHSIERNGAHRRIVVQPSGTGAVTLSLPPGGPACDQAGALCTEDGGRLEVGARTQIRGPAALSVADATVEEAPGAALVFAVTLDRATAAAVQVDYATRDGSAQAGSDYTARSGTLRFAPGEIAKTVEVAVLDDSHDEGSETMTLRLSNPSGAYLADGEATGTIENSDHMPAAWLSRFGRTVAEQVVDAARSRLAGTPAPGGSIQIAGLALTPGGNLDALEPDESTFGERNITGRDLLTGSSFSLATGTANGGTAGLWGRGALSRFSGTEEDLSLDGNVTSLLLGADWAQERSTLGAMVSHTRATGSYQGADQGRVESDLTGLYPYGQHALTSRLSVWGVAGYGVGTLSLTPDGQPSLETDIDLAMAAVGLRSILLEAPGEGGPELAAVTDVMGVRTNSDAVRDEDAGNLARAKTQVSRVRLGVEGAWTGLKVGDADLKPSLELGVRRDGGDAETGTGVDVGAGIAWSNPKTGFSATVQGRGLLTHESDGLRDYGLAGSIAWDPRPESDRGLSLRLTHSSGAPATGGMDALLGRTTLEGLDLTDRSGNPARVEIGLGYGIPAFGGHFTATPEVGLRLSDGERRYRAGWRLGLAARDQGSMELRLDLTRTERPGSEPPEHRAGITLTARW